MANNKLSFAIAINLLTENFKKGTNQVAKGFKSMQMRIATFVAALGFGTIGLTNFMSRLIKTAKDTSRVTTALKNASGGIGNFIGNQKFVNKLANDYKLEVNSLTENFAKFTAGATASGMALSKQKSIFESVAKATAGYNLSVEDTNGVFLALSRMMSKGKVSSRDLKIMMGDKMPIAMQAMAQSMGVPIQQLDKMMAKGELIANDVLPAFATQLEKMAPKIDTDNLTSSLKALENAFGDLTNAAGVESKYKKIIDGVTSIITNAGNNIKSIITAISLGVFFVIVNGAVKVARSLDILAMSRIDKTKGLHAQLVTAEAKKDLELAKLERLRLQQSAATGQARIKIAEKVYIAEKNFGKAVMAEEKARVALTQASASAKVGIATRSINVVKVGMSKLFLTIKSLWATFAPAIIITALASIVMYFKNIYDESKRIKSIFSDYKKNAEQTSSTSEITKLKTLQSLYNDQSSTLKEQQGYKKEIISLIGTEIKGNEDINEVIKERIKLLEASARVDYYTQKKLEAEDKMNSIYGKYGGENKFNSKVAAKNRGNKGLIDDWFSWTHNTELNRDLNELVELRKVLDDSTLAIEQWTKESMKMEHNNSKPGLSMTSEELTKLEEKFAKSLLELDTKLQHNIITQDEYNKAKDDLVRSSFVEAKISKDEVVARSKFLKQLEARLKNPLFDEQQAEIRKVQKNYEDELTKLTNQKANNRLTEKEYDKALVELIAKTVDQISSISDLSDTQKKYIAGLLGSQSNLLAKQTFTPEVRDVTFDYKKSNTDILQEELEVAKKNYSKLKDLAVDNLQQFEKELAKTMANVESMEDAVKLAKLTDDVKVLHKEVQKGSYDSAKTIVGSADNMINSMSRLKDAFSNPDASGWEKIMATWDMMTNAIDNFMQIIELINGLRKATEMLSIAQEAQTAMETALLPTKIANTTAETSVELTASAAKTTAAQTETAAKTTAAYASFPFVGVGLAAAAIAAMFALIPKFKDGGIVGGGATSGDQILARVNAGEMILNQNQQSNLWKMLNNQSSVQSGQVNIGGHIRGADIYLALNNYMKSSGKRL